MSEKYANRSARARSPLRRGEGDRNAAGRENGDGDDEADLRSLLASPDEYERRDAALALVDRAEADGLADETVGALAERLAEDDSADVRQFAVEALGIAGRAGVGAASDAATAVGAALGAGSDAATAVGAALGAGSDSDGGDECARADDDEWVRAEAVVALSRLAPDADALADALDDESGWVRRNAVIALGKTGRATVADLTDRVKNDPHPAVREYAALYLGERAGDAGAVEDAVRLLAAVLARDPEAFVRAKAAESLGELATDRAEQALETHGITDRSDDVKRTAKRALAAARGVDPDRLDVEIDDGPPGGGPQAPGETPDPDGIGPDPDRIADSDRTGPQRGPRR